MIVRSQLKRETLTDGTGTGGSGASGGSGNGGTGDLLGTSSGGGQTGQGSSNTGGGTNTGGAASGNQGTATGENGGAASDWKHGLPSELQQNQSLGRYKSVTDLANAYVNLERHASGKPLVLPGKNATDADWSDFFQKVGVPKDVKDYAVKFKEGVTIEDKFVEGFKAQAHKNGILPKQAQALADWFSEQNANAETELSNTIKQSRQAELQDLQKEWGDGYQKKLGVANAMFSELPPELQKSLKEEGLTGSVKLVKAMAVLAEKFMSEDQIKGSAAGLQAGPTPAEAKAAVDKIMGDFSHPYHKKDHPAHAGAVIEVQKLFESMHKKS